LKFSSPPTARFFHRRAPIALLHSLLSPPRLLIPAAPHAPNVAHPSGPTCPALLVAGGPLLAHGGGPLLQLPTGGPLFNSPSEVPCCRTGRRTCNTGRRAAGRSSRASCLTAALDWLGCTPGVRYIALKEVTSLHKEELTLSKPNQPTKNF